MGQRLEREGGRGGIKKHPLRERRRYYRRVARKAVA